MFRVEVEFANPDGTVWSSANAGGNVVMVTSRMRTTGGGTFELASFGPLWIPPGQVKEGGRAHGTRIAEVRLWRGWEVGVVRASVGMDFEALVVRPSELSVIGGNTPGLGGALQDRGAFGA